MLQVRSLSARRSGRRVFRDISFSLSAGDALLVTGPNGSGKSSLLRALAGLIGAEGDMLWQGESIRADWAAHRSRLCLIGHADAVKPELTVAEQIGYWRALRGLENDALPLGALHLEKLAGAQIRTLSAGQKRRVSLTRLLLADAPLWLLDEPSASLDRVAQEALASLIAGHRAKGGIAVIVAHQGDVPGAKALAMGAA